MKYTKEHIGMVHWSSYWSTYCLVLDVDGDNITELDSFGKINESSNHKIRKHHTALDEGDKFYTIKQFHNLIIKSYNNKEETNE
tara:strand:+ start:13 stop:264 length:252 start_codon:yes stop_codon:yes gene_type:complete